MRPLAQVLTLRLVLMAVFAVTINAVIVAAYYGTGRLETEMLDQITTQMSDALEGETIPDASPFREKFDTYPEAYAFALIGRGGEIVQEVNPTLIPLAATSIYADDWVSRMDRPGGTLLVAGREFPDRTDGLRMVFVMADDPAGLYMRAFWTELYMHVALPLLPMVVLLIGANAILIRRGLAPLAAAATWARGIRPGTPVPPPPVAQLPAEVADLVDATQRALDRMTRALAAESRHAAEAAHALRTPVAVLMARLDALPPGETTERLRDDLSTLSRTVQQVLASSRADMVEVSESAAVDLSAIAAAVTGALAPFAHERGVELTLDSPRAPLMANADTEAVEVALSNLVENAILHGGPGLVEITVGPDSAIRVRDHGPGLPPGAGKRLFTPFWRGRNAVAGGAGLGLAIVERLQRAQGGEVTACTAEDSGALFVLHYRPSVA